MTSRERLTAVLNGRLPDCVPVSPDVSNMVPARMTGLPFWDIYLYQKIPQWKAYIDCVRHFGFDSFMDGYARILFEDLGEIDREVREAVVMKNDDRIITRKYRAANGKVFWEPLVSVYFRDNPPVRDIDPARVGADFMPSHFEPVEVQGPYAGIEGESLLKLVKDEMGEHGLVGVWCGRSTFVTNTQQVYDYYDDPEPFIEASREYLDRSVIRFRKLMSLKTKPDFICTGGSGTLEYQTVDMFRALGLPVVKKITELCREHGIPSHVHSCGPERELVKICYEETDLTVIDPLEIPPMGNCDLKTLKELYGDRLVLKGNLHTTDVMLRGSAEDVRRASRKAIDDAAKGGRFILSTGDQCGRDTPDENLFAMIETARTYGRYS